MSNQETDPLVLWCCFVDEAVTKEDIKIINVVFLYDDALFEGADNLLSFLHQTADLLCVFDGAVPEQYTTPEQRRELSTRQVNQAYVFAFTPFSLAQACSLSQCSGQVLWNSLNALMDARSRGQFSQIDLLRDYIQDDSLYFGADKSSIQRDFSGNTAVYTIVTPKWAIVETLRIEQCLEDGGHETVTVDQSSSNLRPFDLFRARLRIPADHTTTHEERESWLKNFKLRMFTEFDVHFTDEFDPASEVYRTSPKPCLGMRLFRENLSKHPRDYQVIAVNRIQTGYSKCLRSGIIVAPCGSGKTLIGIMIMRALGRPVLLFCSSSLALIQWQEHICACLNLTKTTDVFSMTASNMTSVVPGESGFQAPCVVLTTYNMFSGSTFVPSTAAQDPDGTYVDVSAASNKPSNRSVTTAAWMNYCKTREWGAIILDEVHQAPADNFSKLVTGFKAHLKYGLTATLVREDDRVTQLDFLVGPVLYKIDTPSLRRANFVSSVECVEVKCGPASAPAVGAHAVINLYKIRAYACLLAMHLTRGDKCLVFCDNLNALHLYSQISGYPVLQGDTSVKTRRELIKKFRETKGGEVLLLSKVGDQSIDIPEANVVIQLSTPHGSRMQELQRAGRIQRIDASKKASGKTGFQLSTFYSLVSAWDDSEQSFAEHRKQYLSKHGYVMKTVSWEEFRHAEVEETFNRPGVWETCTALLTTMTNEMELEDVDEEVELKSRGKKRKTADNQASGSAKRTKTSDAKTAAAASTPPAALRPGPKSDAELESEKNRKKFLAMLSKRI